MLENLYRKACSDLKRRSSGRYGEQQPRHALSLFPFFSSSVPDRRGLHLPTVGDTDRILVHLDGFRTTECGGRTGHLGFKSVHV